MRPPTYSLRHEERNIVYTVLSPPPYACCTFHAADTADEAQPLATGRNSVFENKPFPRRVNRFLKIYVLIRIVPNKNPHEQSTELSFIIIVVIEKHTGTIPFRWSSTKHHPIEYFPDEIA